MVFVSAKFLGFTKIDKFFWNFQACAEIFFFVFSHNYSTVTRCMCDYKQNCKLYMAVLSNNASGIPPASFQRLGWLQTYAHVRCATLGFEENVATRNPVFLFIFWLICFIFGINLCFISVSFYVIKLSFKTSTNCRGKKNKKKRNTPFYPGGEEHEDFKLLDTTTRMGLLHLVTTRENMSMQVFQIFTLSSPTTDRIFLHENQWYLGYVSFGWPKYFI